MADAEPLLEFVFSEHATQQMARRGLDDSLVASVLAEPDERRELRPGRVVLQSELMLDDRTYLVRVIVDINESPAVVVTAYRTRKVDKYRGRGR